MKTLIPILSFFLASFAFGQSYAPFNANIPKRFQDQTNTSDNDYYFYPIQTDTIGDTIVYKQYLQKSHLLVIDTIASCIEGYGNEKYPVIPTWLGSKVIFDTTIQTLFLSNSLYEAINFNFGISLGDSTIFYHSVDEIYYLKYESINQELVLDSNQMVKTFTIWKYDGIGTTLPSALNGFEIKISENLGLVSFINCYDFPVVEKGLNLMGQLNPTLGYYQMTNDDAFPWNTGDEIEVRGYSSDAATMSTTTSYRLLSIQNRIETTDSVWIYFDVAERLEFIPPGGPFSAYPTASNINYSNPIKYKKGEVVCNVPNNMTNYYGTSFSNDSSYFCGNNSTYTISDAFLMYCDSCNCFIPRDGDFQELEESTIEENLGITHQAMYNDEDLDMTLSSSAELIYSKIAGVECGEKVYVGLEELKMNVGVNPNPTNDLFEISSSFEITSLEVSNSQGISCLSISPNEFNYTISIAHLDSGIYFIELNGRSGQNKVVKIVKN